MARRLLIFFAALVATITLRRILTTVQRNDVRPSDERNYPQSGSGTAQHNHRATSANTGQPPPSLPPKTNFPSPDDNKDGAHKHPRDWLDYGTFTIGVLTFVVVLVGTGIALATLKTLNNTVMEMVKQTPEIQRSAKAAEDAANHAQDAIVLLESAEIILDTVNLSPAGVIGSSTRVIATSKNVGRSTAKDVVSKWWMRGPGIPPPKPQTPRPTIVGPQATLVSIAQGSDLLGVLGPDRLTLFQLGKQPLELVGTVTYRDVFNRPHCYAFSGLFIYALKVFGAHVDTSTVIRDGDACEPPTQPN